MGNVVINILKKICKICVVILGIFAVLAVIYYGVDFAFHNFLSSTARAVFSNFIVFALIIGYVMRQIVHPKSMLEIAQTSIENEIKDSEIAKDESETRLDAIQKSARGVKKEINAILKKSEENAQLVGAKILQDAEKTAVLVKDNADKVVENNQILLKNELIKRASLASVEVAKLHIINELNNNSDLHNKLIDESIEAIEEVGL